MTLRLKNIWKTYDDRVILSGLDLEVQEGSIAGITGRSGAGKTTLGRIINLLEPYEKGSMQLFGKEISQKQRIVMQRKMVMVFQKPVMFNQSVLENAAFGLMLRRYNKKNAFSRAKTMLQKWGITDFERNALSLSGGEKQRISLIQAIILEPELLLLDEPTANLDEKNIRLLEKNLKAMNKKKHSTIIIFSHDIVHLENICSHLYELKNRRLYLL